MQVITDIIYSPDDGGWYAQESDLDACRSRVTRRIYPTRTAVEKAVASGKKIWEKWN